MYSLVGDDSSPAIFSGVYFRTKAIKGTPVVQLVEAFRNPEGQPRQRILASPGDGRLPEADRTRIARAIEDHLAGKPQLLIDAPLSEEAASRVTRILKLLGRSRTARPAATEKIDGVLLDKIQTENVVQFGPQCVAMSAWKELGLTGLLEDAGLNTVQTATAQLMVANCLIAPSVNEHSSIGRTAPHRPARTAWHPHHQEPQSPPRQEQAKAQRLPASGRGHGI